MCVFEGGVCMCDGVWGMMVLTSSNLIRWWRPGCAGVRVRVEGWMCIFLISRVLGVCV